jgi:actin-related protein 5
MLRNMCSFSAEYTERLRKLKNPLELRSVERVVQFPYTVPTENEKTEEEVARLTEKRREQGRRLQETQAKIRLEQVRDVQFVSKHALKELAGRLRKTKRHCRLCLNCAIAKQRTGSVTGWSVCLTRACVRCLTVSQNALKEEDIEDEAELEQSIKKLEKTIKAAKKKETGEADVAEEPATNLLDVPDEDVSTEPELTLASLTSTSA